MCNAFCLKQVDIISSTSILLVTEENAIGNEVWGKVEESLIHASKDYPGFDSRLHGWTLIRQMDNIFWERILEEPGITLSSDVESPEIGYIESW